MLNISPFGRTFIRATVLALRSPKNSNQQQFYPGLGKITGLVNRKKNKGASHWARPIWPARSGLAGLDLGRGAWAACWVGSDWAVEGRGPPCRAGLPVPTEAAGGGGAVHAGEGWRYGACTKRGEAGAADPA